MNRYPIATLAACAALAALVVFRPDLANTGLVVVPVLLLAAVLLVKLRSL